MRAAARLAEYGYSDVAVLEGGTWATGRLLAKEQRDGSPPLKITSDGTVF